MTYSDALKWAVVPAIGAVLLVVGNGAYYYIDQPDRWRNSLIINGLVGIPATGLLVYVVSFLCIAVVVTLVNFVRKFPART